ncbi:MAG: hypothetical protein HY316_03785 [Acidobacteria bacterium]|nr:hypothetical protein [Acidobacteriota bacterium]
MDFPDGRKQDVEEGLPPVFSTWGRLYAAVIGFLALLIFLFYLFTKAYQFPQ